VEISEVERLAGLTKLFVGTTDEVTLRQGSTVAIEGGHVVGLRLVDVRVGTLGALQLPHLRWLELIRTRLTSLQGLDRSAQLERLRVSEVSLVTFTGLAALPSLKHLDVSYSSISSLESLPPLAALETLDLSRLKLTSLSALPALPRLKTVLLGGLTAATLEGLERAPALEYVDLQDSRVSDLSVLALLPVLKTVDLTRTGLQARPALPVTVKVRREGGEWPAPAAEAPRPADGGRPILTVWNGIPLPEPDQPFVKGLPARSGSASSFNGVWTVSGVSGATVLKTSDGKTHGRLRVTVEQGRVRAYLEYLGGYHVMCEAAADRPCEVTGALYSGSHSSNTRKSILAGPTNFEVVIESLEGEAKGIRFEFAPR
jgi:hypothetical protein